ncbi:vacuolar H+-ATPase E subunit, partial [Reticulomyxa filosa]
MATTRQDSDPQKRIDQMKNFIFTDGLKLLYAEARERAGKNTTHTKKKKKNLFKKKKLKKLKNGKMKIAKTKANEIKMSADAEFQHEKGRILQPERIRIIQEYDKKKKQLEIEQRIEFSKRVNESRLQVLKEREKLMKQTQEKTFQKLAELKSNRKAYEKFVKSLIIQGLIRMDERIVEIQVVKEDLEVARAVTQDAAREYIQIMKQQSNKEVTLEIKLDENDFLPAGAVGGKNYLGQYFAIQIENCFGNFDAYFK